MGSQASTPQDPNNATGSTVTEDDVDILPMMYTFTDTDTYTYSDEDSYSSELFEDEYNLAGYEFVKILGRGAAGTVVEMIKEGQSFAVKVINIKNSRLNFLNPQSMDPKEEALLLKRINYKSVVKVYDFIEDLDNMKLYIVMELLRGGTIGGKKTEEEKRNIFGQVLSGIAAIHSMRLAHRDIKIDNIMVHDDGSIRLVDFGIAKYVPKESDMIQTEMKCTPAYASPEIFTSTQYNPFAADIWSLGITLYAMMFEKMPFNAGNIPTIQNLICNTEPVYPEDANPKLIDLLKKMLEKDPTKRITMMQMWQHPYTEGVIPVFLHLMLRVKNIVTGFTSTELKNSVVKINRGKIAPINKVKKHHHHHHHKHVHKHHHHHHHDEDE